jgi:hypothetical protein
MQARGIDAQRCIGKVRLAHACNFYMAELTWINPLSGKRPVAIAHAQGKRRFPVRVCDAAHGNGKPLDRAHIFHGLPIEPSPGKKQEDICVLFGIEVRSLHGGDYFMQTQQKRHGRENCAAKLPPPSYFQQSKELHHE